MNNLKGLFITFEGGEGTGKSTQSKLLYNNLLNKDIDVLLTREPGGSKEAEEIRNILIKGDINKWDPITESLLHNAARREHIKNIIKPTFNPPDWIFAPVWITLYLMIAVAAWLIWSSPTKPSKKKGNNDDSP